MSAIIAGCIRENKRDLSDLAEISGTHAAPHDFCISRFWYVADKQNFVGSERFAE
jgi:hypothetical protein